MVVAASLLIPSVAQARISDAEPAAPRIVVRFADGTPTGAQARILAAHGAVALRWIPELDMAVADVAASDPSRAILGLFEEPEVLSADPDRERAATGSFAPSHEDPAWALRRVGAAAIDPVGFSTLAILDTGVDVADANLTGQLMSGWSAFGTDPLADPNGHGTALAEIAAGSSLDGDAISGVASDGVLVLPIQVLDDRGIGRDSDIVRGIVEAVDRGADVLLMGFAGFGYSNALQAAIDYAWLRGVVLVAPVGDDASPAPRFPAGNAKVVGVGATNGFDARWQGSAVGTATFIAAPGDGVPISSGAFTGTAAAAAMVSGAAALLAAVDRAATNDAVVGRLARGADAVGPHGEVGNGRLDLSASLADRSEVGITPRGVLDGPGGPFVTTYRESGAPLAGWARAHLAELGAGLHRPALQGDAVLQLPGGASSSVAPALSLATSHLAGDEGASAAAIFRYRSFVLGSTSADPLASDHGTFTYGAVSPPAVEYGVLS